VILWGKVVLSCPLTIKDRRKNKLAPLLSSLRGRTSCSSATVASAAAGADSSPRHLPPRALVLREWARLAFDEAFGGDDAREIACIRRSPTMIDLYYWTTPNGLQRWFEIIRARPATPARPRQGERGQGAAHQRRGVAQDFLRAGRAHGARVSTERPLLPGASVRNQQPSGEARRLTMRIG
jgi:hypothetical protein